MKKESGLCSWKSRVDLTMVMNEVATCLIMSNFEIMKAEIRLKIEY